MSKNFSIMSKYKSLMRYLSAILSLLLFIGCILFFSSSSSPDAVLSKTEHITTPPFLPTKVDFAGEPVPLQFFDVRESFEREMIVNVNFHSNTLQYLKRITRFFPVIEPILKANGIPDDFKYLALIESDFLNKVSPKGATGFWQFMRSAASDYNLEVSDEIDERYHLEKATVAACNYLNDAYKQFGSWTMAAAAYNMGRKGLSTQIERQKCDYYYDLLLNEETTRYIFRIVAAKTILNDAKRYGFSVPEDERYRPIPYTEVVVKSAVESWADFSHEHNTNYKMLKILNPWLRDTKLVNRQKKTYVIKVPTQR